MTTPILRLFCLGLFLVAAPLSACAEEGADDLVIGDAWARASVTANSAAYLTIENKTETDDTLLEVRSDVAEKVEIHDMTMEEMVMRMRRLNALPVKAGETVTLAPGGLHIMLIRLKQPLSEGMSVPLTLVFEKAGNIGVSAPVRAAGHSSH